MRRTPLTLVTTLTLAIVGAASLAVATQPDAVGMPSELGAPGLEGLPPRPANAPTGSEFAQRTTAVDGGARQRAAVREILAGNVPDFLRQFQPVHLTYSSPGDGTTHEATVWVLPDYLAVGTDEDFLRMPLTTPSIAAVARALDVTLPTTRIVDAVYEQARHDLRPQPLPPGPRMRSSGYYLRHRELIEGQYGGWPRSEIVAGHKKDVVLTSRLKSRSDRIAIYGWHRHPHDPIQPLSTVHGARYADYSHGVRLVSTRVWLDGEERSIWDVLADPGLAPVLSNEGPITNARSLLAIAAGSPAG